MIKHRELVFKMSLEEKIRLVTSVNTGENCPVDNYEFPVFKLSNYPAENTAGGYATIFPSDKALASTWNMPLVRDIYKCIGNEAKANVPYAYFNTSNNLNTADISEDYFLTGQFLSNKARGVNQSGAPVNFENIPAGCGKRTLKERVKDISDLVMRESKPDSVLVDSTQEAENMPLTYKYDGCIFGIASTKEEVAKYLYLGCSLVFLKEDFTDELVLHLTGLTEKFRSSREEYESRAINIAEFDRRARNCEILDEEIINSACDSMIDTLLRLKSCNAASIAEKGTSLGKETHTPKFNEVLHDNMASEAAAQSCVLLKNNNAVLPLDKHTKIAVIGEYAKNKKYYTDFTKDTPTVIRLPFEVINDYELNAIGYAHGYLRGQSGRADLLETACELCKDADYALLYLYCEKGEHTLPQGQLELIDQLTLHGVKIIAVVSAHSVIDMSFAGKCQAVLFNYRGGQGEATAVLDIISGNACPSGRLIECLPCGTGNYRYSELPAYRTAGSGDDGYVFGYGLSYTTFTYSNLKVTENGIRCLVANTGSADGYAVVQLYVKKEESNSTLSEKTLRGFAKVFIKKNDAALVEIPFDANTFRTYDLFSDNYEIEGGNYNILIAENANDVKLSSVITLTKHSFNNGEFKNEKVDIDETMPVGFTSTKQDKAIRREKAGLSFGVKLFLVIVLAVYYNGMGGALTYINLLNGNNLLFQIVIGVLLAIGDVLAIVFIVLIARKRKLQKYLHPNDVLSDLVEKVSPFNEIAKVSYVEPVAAPAEIEKIEEEQSGEAEEYEEAQEKVKTYENTFESGNDEVVFTKQATFGELCANFRAYAAQNGVSIEASSARALFAAISSSKLVLLSCKNTEVLPDLLKVISSYFSGVSVAASDGWQSPDDLLWRQDGDRYIPSEFANAVNSASLANDKNCVAVLSNVNINNLKSYFGDFIGYSLFPSEAHTLVLNEELSLRLPDNICYILVPADGSSFENVPAEIAHASLQIDILASKAETAVGEVEVKTISHSGLVNLIADSREQHYLPEKIWKKLDELVEAICATERFAIGNKNTLCIEKYSSILLECGGDEGEAFVSTFTAKIAPLLKTLKLYGKENGGKTIYGIVEKLFGEEDLSKIQKALINA